MPVDWTSFHKITEKLDPMGKHMSKISLAQELRGKKIPVTRRSMVSMNSFSERHQRLRGKVSNISLQSTRNPNYARTTQLDEEMWVLYGNSFDDEADVSIHPSYEIMNFAYDLNCYLRYLESVEKYERQFQREMRQFISTRRTICEQYFCKGVLAYTTLWPPLHNKRELDNFCKNFFQLTDAEKKRVEFLMNTDLSHGF